MNEILQLKSNETNDEECEEILPVKCSKYRKWSVIPVLNHINTASEVPLVEANILRLRERNIIPHVLKKLQPLSPEYGHLKRVKNGQLLINIGNENELPDLIWLKELLNEEPEIITCKVPRQKPLIKKQYVFAKDYWPTTFHKDNILESKLDGTFFTEKQIDQITAVFVRAEMEKGAFFYDVKQKLIVCKAEPNPTKPLCHPVMSCIENLATKQMENTSQQYLGTGFDAILAEEPCTMCAMAMVHCRIKRVFFGKPNERYGALLSRWRLQELPNLNHHFEVFQIIEIL